jgi:Chromo (CHRromatin Organisation MOdifier) domain
VPLGRHDVFHVDLLRLTGSDPFPTQAVDDWQPEGAHFDEEEEEGEEGEFEVEKVLGERKRGRRQFVLVKWVGYAAPTWEPIEEISHTTAYSEFERRRRGGGL